MFGLGDVDPSVIERTRAYYKNARLAAAQGNQAEAERYFRMAEGDATYGGFLSDPRISDEREYARQAVLGSPQERAAAQSDTRAGQALVAQGRTNAQPVGILQSFMQPEPTPRPAPTQAAPVAVAAQSPPPSAPAFITTAWPTVKPVAQSSAPVSAASPVSNYLKIALAVGGVAVVAWVALPFIAKRLALRHRSS